ncbi:hypothetical protein P8C59_006470 [Phyllachora maydis]|uniref:Uncharacterized protein n=1 Tax=Phyllachora maydis TaxID=1825666 RepID=A0AAD9I6D7_9PEZI|nr:hypothetical protein P8C59_006470 [Phyllachora maydis]
MYIYIAFLPYRCYYRDLSFANLLITDIDSFSNLDNSVYDILAAYKAKQRELAKAYTTTYKLAKKEGLRRSKRTTSGNAGRYTTDSSLIANKDDNNAYNRAYMPPTDIEEKKGSSSNNNGVNGSTSDSANKGKGSGIHKRSEGTLYCKDILPRK